MVQTSEKKPFRFDLHTHSVRSDGTETPDELLQAAQEAGLGALALTDHNCLDTALAAELTRRYGLEVIPACEFSALHTTAGGRREIHIIGLWLEETREIRAVLQKNRLERRPYVMAYLRELVRLGIDLSPDGSRSPERAYRQLELENRGAAYGRLAICKRMVSMGYVSSIEEGFRDWIGRGPEDHPRVHIHPEDFMCYAAPDEVVSAIHSCPGGVAVLCHPFYPTPPEEAADLVAYFKLQLHGDAMEVCYGTGTAAYSQAQIAVLSGLAQQYGLLPSAGSDRHSPSRPFSQDRPEVFHQLAQYHARLLHTGR